MADRLLGILRHQALEFGLGLFVLEMRRPGPGEDHGKLRPGIGRAHIDDAHRLNARLRRLDPEQSRGFAALDTAPELALRGDDQVLVERIGMGRDLDPLAAAGDHREDRSPGRHHPHVMLQLRHVLLGGRLLRERPGQHEFGFEYRAAAFDPAVERGRHPSERRMPDPPLDIRDDLPGIGLVPAPVEVLGRDTKLDDEIAGKVLRLDFTALFPPQPDESGLIVAHDDPGVRAADEIAALRTRI